MTHRYLVTVVIPLYVVVCLVCAYLCGSCKVKVGKEAVSNTILKFQLEIPE